MKEREKKNTVNRFTKFMLILRFLKKIFFSQTFLSSPFNPQLKFASSSYMFATRLGCKDETRPQSSNIIARKLNGKLCSTLSVPRYLPGDACCTNSSDKFKLK